MPFPPPPQRLQRTADNGRHRAATVGKCGKIRVSSFVPHKCAKSTKKTNGFRPANFAAWRDDLIFSRLLAKRLFGLMTHSIPAQSCSASRERAPAVNRRARNPLRK